MHPDANDPDRRITYFAATHTRGKREIFGIRGDDRGKHIYVIGKTGMGKSTMLENMAIQDIQNGEGLAFIDPHGATAEKLLDFVPQNRVKDVVYFAPFDTENPIGFNVMEDVGYDKRHLVVSGLMGALKRIWVDAWSARMEYILQNTLLALLEYPDSTLLDVNRMLTNKTFRQDVVTKISDPVVKSFWTEEFAAFTDTYTREATPAIQNKIGQFTANPLIRNIVGQAKSTFDLRKMMDEKKIFIVNLSKGRMGETNAALLGSMLVVKIYLAAMSRASEPASRMTKLPRFYFYVDEFQSMMNEAFADILSESRKYKLALTLANQYIEQMEENVRDAVFGNIGTLIVFRVGPFDAEVLKTVFEPTFMVEDLVGLGIGQIYLTLMIDGVGSQPFSAETIPPIENPSISYRDDVIENSRAQFSRPRAEIEDIVRKRQIEFVPPPKPKARKEYGASAAPRRTDAGQRGEAPRDRMNTDSAPRRYPREGENPRPMPTRASASGLRTDSSRVDVLAKSTIPPRISNSASNMAEHHSALRDAIQKATNVRETPANSFAAKSPAEIMREQMLAGRNENTREPEPKSPPGAHAEQPEEKSQTSVPKGRDGEVSPDVLREILREKEDIDKK